MKKVFTIIAVLFLFIHSSFGVITHAQTRKLPAEFANRSPDCRSVVVYSSVSDGKSDNEKDVERPGETYAEYSNSLDKEKKAYHKYLNKRFEINIVAISRALQKAKDLSEKDVNEIVGNEQFSTWKLASDLVCSYEKYSKYVNYFAFVHEISQESTVQEQNVRELLQAIDSDVNSWKRELADAKKALDLALATYDHFVIAFPMHLKYRQVIQELILYREQFRLLRELISCLPSKFVNQSTAKCE